MFLFDIETLGKKSDSVILSMACLYFVPEKHPSFNELKENVFFVKFDAKDQSQRLKRTVQRDTIDWWNKQCTFVKKRSFIPNIEIDVNLEYGLMLLKKWTSGYSNSKKEWVWARGSLDQMVLQDAEDSLGIESCFPYNNWRDVRTAIDFLYNSRNGYCEVMAEGFDSYNDITKHDPVDDCLYDAMMLMYGVNREEKIDNG